jgi:hypothetical protein
MAAFAIAGAVLAATAPAAAMSGYKWKYRPLVVFAPTAGHPALAQQRAIVAGLRPAFQDRNIVVVMVVGDTVGSDLGPSPGMGASALRSRFGVAPGAFRAILVGKDGGVKLSSGAAIPAQTLFSTIDAMPMRKEEMKRR